MVLASSDGLVDAGDFEFFAGCMAGRGVLTPPGGVDPDDFAACDFDGDGDVDLADFAAIPRAAGQVDTGSTYTWNAENRLMSVARTYPALADPNEPPPVKVEFRYDYLGRRIEKRVLTWNPALNSGAGGWDAANPTKVTRFIWSGWLMLLELDGLSDCGTPGAPAECVVRRYTWGLDLAGQNGQVNSLESAGAISGLLAAYDPNANLPLWYFYDANGNVGQVLTMISVDGENYGIIPAAKYEYDPYGNRINTPARGEYAQPFQFSTHQFDPETGHIYAKERYYLPNEGRWLSADPIGEEGGLHLRAYVLNSPIGHVDPFGLLSDTDDAEPRQVCCQYAEMTGMQYKWKRCQKTESCPASATTPEECCSCCGVSLGAYARVRRLSGASWGACCWCTMYRARPSGMSWPMHQSFFLVCPSWSQKIDFYFKRVTSWGWSIGQEVAIVPGSTNPENDPGGWVVQHKAKISCDTAASMLAQAEADVKEPPDYNFITDCHWYARRLFNAGLDGVTECE